MKAALALPRTRFANKQVAPELDNILIRHTFENGCSIKRLIDPWRGHFLFVKRDNFATLFEPEAQLASCLTASFSQTPVLASLLLAR
jgi:hypothetical protein